MSNGDARLRETLSDAARVQRGHQQLIDAIGIPASDSALQRALDSITGLRRAYVTYELGRRNYDSPQQLHGLRPDEAVVLAVRADLADTEQRLDALLRSRSLVRRLQKTVSRTQIDLIAQSAGVALERAGAGVARAGGGIGGALQGLADSLGVAVRWLGLGLAALAVLFVMRKK